MAPGIGRYKGLELLEQHGRTEELLDVEFAAGTRIYVPASCRSTSAARGLPPKFAKIGGELWEKQKLAVTLRQAAMKKGRTVRIVDQKTVVLRLSDKTLAALDRLVAALVSFLAPGRAAVGL